MFLFELDVDGSCNCPSSKNNRKRKQANMRTDIQTKNKLEGNITNQKAFTC